MDLLVAQTIQIYIIISILQATTIKIVCRAIIFLVPLVAVFSCYVSYNLFHLSVVCIYMYILLVGARQKIDMSCPFDVIKVAPKRSTLQTFTYTFHKKRASNLLPYAAIFIIRIYIRCINAELTQINRIINERVV